MITIMTPTFNRAYILDKAYLSLKDQTCFDFEWIIIDDGSSDNTEQLVSEWVNECKDFDIIYFKQPNGGKHRAVNRAVKMAHYDWFMILDSDDSLTTDAVETIHGWIKQSENTENLAGIAGLKGNSTQAIGGTPSFEYVDATNLERKKYGLLGDKAEIHKTEVLKKYPFPEFEGETFIRESASWDRMAQDGLKIRWFSKVIYLCEYIEDGLTKNTNVDTYVRNFKGFTDCSALYVKTHSLILSIHKCGEFNRVAKKKGLKAGQSAKLLEVNPLFFRAGILLFGIKNLIKRIIRR